MTTVQSKFFRLGEEVWAYGRKGIVTEIENGLVAVKFPNKTIWLEPTVVKRMCELNDRDYLRVLAKKLETALVYNQDESWTYDILRVQQIAEKL